MKEDEPSSSRSPFPPEESLHASPGPRIVWKELLGKSLPPPWMAVLELFLVDELPALAYGCSNHIQIRLQIIIS